MDTTQNTTLEPVWTVTANIVKERKAGPGGSETHVGTKLFSPGTKVYVIDWFPGTCKDIMVVGLSRKPKRFIKLIIRVNWIENLRVKLCYAPTALQKIYDHFDTESDSINRLNQGFVEEMLATIPLWQENMI